MEISSLKKDLAFERESNISSLDMSKQAASEKDQIINGLHDRIMDLSWPTDSKDWVIIENLWDIISELKQDLANAESKVTDDQDVTTIM